MFFNLWAKASYFLKDFYGYLLLLLVAFIILPLIAYKVFKSGLTLNLKRFYTSLVFSFLIVVISFVALEAYFRFVYDQSDGLGFLQVNRKWLERHVVANNNFYRDRNFDVSKKEGTIRIGAIGDSLTFGGGIKDVNNRFTNLLEKKLKEAGYNVEVYNLGKSGEDTQGEIKNYQNIKYLNFDIIVWQYFLNDIQPLNNSTGTTIINRESQTTPLISFLSHKSYLFDYLYWRFSSKYQKTFAGLKTADLARYQEIETLGKHKEDITNFLHELKVENKKVVVVIFPFVHLLPDYPAANIHKEMAKTFSESGAEVIDLLDYLQGQKAKDLVASPFDSHPNEYVHALAAGSLFEKIVPLLKDTNP